MLLEQWPFPDSIFSALTALLYPHQHPALQFQLFPYLSIIFLETGWDLAGGASWPGPAPPEGKLMSLGPGEPACLFQLCLHQYGWMHGSQEEVPPSACSGRSWPSCGSHRVLEDVVRLWASPPRCFRLDCSGLGEGSLRSASALRVHALEADTGFMYNGSRKCLDCPLHCCTRSLEHVLITSGESLGKA